MPKEFVRKFIVAMAVLAFFGVARSSGIAQVTLDATAGELNNLTRGYTYTLDADINATVPVTPVVNGSEAGIPMNFVLTSDPLTNVTLTFTLPTFMIGTVAGSMQCSFPSNGLYYEETGQRFDPNGPVTVQVGAGGTATFDLGITITVPPTAAVDDYNASLSCIATITGF